MPQTRSSTKGTATSDAPNIPRRAKRSNSTSTTTRRSKKARRNAIDFHSGRSIDTDEQAIDEANGDEDVPPWLQGVALPKPASPRAWAPDGLKSSDEEEDEDDQDFIVPEPEAEPRIATPRGRHDMEAPTTAAPDLNLPMVPDMELFGLDFDLSAFENVPPPTPRVREPSGRAARILEDLRQSRQDKGKGKAKPAAGNVEIDGQDDFVHFGDF